MSLIGSKLFLGKSQGLQGQLNTLSRLAQGACQHSFDQPSQRVLGRVDAGSVHLDNTCPSRPLRTVQAK